MSKAVPQDGNSENYSRLDTSRMHSSIDLEAISVAPLSPLAATTGNHFESTDRILEQLRRRIGQLYGATDYDHTLSRVGLVLITLESCIARLDQGQRAISQSPSLMAIIHEIDKCCVMIEHETKIKNEDRESVWTPLIRLLEKDDHSATTLPHRLEQQISALHQRIDKNSLVNREDIDRLANHLAAFRDVQLSENRKLFASLGALQGTIQRCVDRLSRVENSLMEARSVETSSVIAEWPQTMQGVHLNCGQEDEPAPRSIDPRSALAAARGAGRASGPGANSKKLQ